MTFSRIDIGAWRRAFWMSDILFDSNKFCGDLRQKSVKEKCFIAVMADERC